MEKKTGFTGISLFISLVAALGGLLFGYNTSVISGAILFLTRDFALTTLQQELVVSTVLIGALIGALIGGFIADGVGRKKTLFVTLVLFFIGTLILCYAYSIDSLLLGRFITGLAIGIASLAVPLYIAEIAPPGSRGMLVSLNQLLITVGILLAYIVSYHYADKKEWRDMIGFGFLPVIVQFIGLFFIPETPSWLLSRGKKDKAEKALRWIRGTEDAFFANLIRGQEDAPASQGWKSLFAKGVRRPFLIGIGISVFQQITGINTVIYYAPRIFELAGYQTAQTAILATVWVGIVNVVLTVIALWLIDRVGRRFLLFTGLFGMTISLGILGFSFIGNAEHMADMAIGSLLFYVAFFAISLGPVAWLIIAEIYPLGIRGRAMGVATFANWVSNYIVSLTFLSLLESLGTGYTFWLYTVICLLGIWFVFSLVPETKGKTFEEIQDFWKK